MHGATQQVSHGSTGAGIGLTTTNGQQLFDSGTFGTQGKGHCGQYGGVYETPGCVEICFRTTCKAGGV
jgi:hypothetical protein